MVKVVLSELYGIETELKRFGYNKRFKPIYDLL